MYAFRPPALIPLNQGKEETSSPVRQACAVVREGPHPRGASVEPTIIGTTIFQEESHKNFRLCTRVLRVGHVALRDR